MKDKIFRQISLVISFINPHIRWRTISFGGSNDSPLNTMTEDGHGERSDNARIYK